VCVCVCVRARTRVHVHAQCTHEREKQREKETDCDCTAKPQLLCLSSLCPWILLPLFLRREKGHFVPTKKPATLFCIDKAIYSKFFVSPAISYSQCFSMSVF
jgi:hypothetical protein